MHVYHLAVCVYLCLQQVCSVAGRGTLFLVCTCVFVCLPVRVVGVRNSMKPDLSECTLELIHTQLP